jgi:predicted transcriptional regulator
MLLQEVVALLGARFVSSCCNPTIDVRAGFAADLMSDALRYDLSQALLVSGLANPQVVRTAEMADVAAILMVRGKVPSTDALELADEIGIPFLTTEFTMFESCGLLHRAGLPACQRFNGR